ncbi:MAG TPA: hypothetical protein VLH60_02725 [Sedimentisphaerales bacterium]|nr:hypothetical protein [Sedimentisphaerales bacterium]
MIVCKCPACSKEYNVHDELAGRSAKCSCGHRFVIPALSEPSPTTQPPAPADDLPLAPPPTPLEQDVFEAAPPVPAPAAAQPANAAKQFTPFKPASFPTHPPQAVAAPVSRPSTAVPEDSGGGVGRLVFILALVFVTIIAAVLGMMARHSGTGMRLLALVWSIISIAGMFVVTQARLLNIGYNEWLALLWAVPGVNFLLIGGCAVLPEGFKPDKRSDAPKKTGAATHIAAAILIGLGFGAACMAFAYYLLFIA